MMVSYDAVLSLYDRSVCGFPTEAEDARSLRRIASLLRPGRLACVRQSTTGPFTCRKCAADLGARHPTGLS